MSTTSSLNTYPASESLASNPRPEGGKPVAKLSVEGLNKHYGDAHVVRDVELEVNSNEVVTLLGPSGSGKTTTMMMVAGFVSPDSGNVRLDGRIINRVPPYQRNIGVVFQSYGLFPHMTVADNVEFPLRQRGINRAQARDKAQQMLELVGLGHLRSRKIPQLSGGQQQRVALARALVFDPPLLIMDEPLSALDKRLREQMQEEIKYIQKAVGVTVLCVTHDQTEAFVLSDRVAVMNEGEIVQIGAPQEVYENPVDDFVAEFLGESNLLRGAVEQRESGKTFVTEGGLTLSLDASAPDTNVLLIRPERIELTERSEVPLATTGTSIDGRIVSASYLGNAVSYRVETDDIQLLVRQAVGAGSILPLGQSVSVRIASGACVPIRS